MSGRNETIETEETYRGEHERDGFAPDGGVVAVTSMTTLSGGDILQPSVNDDEHQEESDPRTERARTEEMDVSLLRKGGVYEVQSASGNTYEVDIASKRCTCPDFTKRQPSGGCKHLRRVDIEIRNQTVPRPDGRLPTTTDERGQFVEVIHNLEREMEEQEAKYQDLQTALKVLTKFL